MHIKIYNIVLAETILFHYPRYKHTDAISIIVFEHLPLQVSLDGVNVKKTGEASPEIVIIIIHLNF